METRTTLDANIKDFKTCIKNRKIKTKMNGHTFPCRFNYGTDTISQGILKFYCEFGAAYLRITATHQIMEAKIPLSVINGSNVQGTTIQFTMEPDLCQFPVLLTFQSQEQCELAFEEFKKFERNPTRQITPSSSSNAEN